MTQLIYNVRLAGDATPDAWILIEGDKIKSVGHGTAPASDICHDGGAALAMPGVIDCHVHFREPGLTAKADIHTESRAALAGGVTSYLEMPNTKPPTTTVERIDEKEQIARRHSAANYAFFIGATNDNIDQLQRADYTRVPGVKLFMGSSTGNMLVDDSASIARIFRDVPAIVAVHAEDQNIISSNIAEYKSAHADGVPVEIRMHSVLRNSRACMESSSKAVALARKYHHRLHLCHITTAAELSLLQPGDPSGKLITAEVSPHHLMWCDDDYARKGALIKMNPAVKSRNDRDALRQALVDELIDIVATDHAPHLLADKEGDALTATSGAPLVQFALPWMLTHFPEEVVQRVMCANPAKVYGIEGRGALAPGLFADIVLVDDAPMTISNDHVISKCRWTPLAGETVTRTVGRVWLNGVLAYDHGTFTGAKAMPLNFSN